MKVFKIKEFLMAKKNVCKTLQVFRKFKSLVSNTVKFPKKIQKQETEVFIIKCGKSIKFETCCCSDYFDYIKNLEIGIFFHLNLKNFFSKSLKIGFVLNNVLTKFSKQ